MAAAQATGKRVEDPSQRSDTSETFANPDGTWTLDSAPEPVRVQDGSGTWHAIDTTLVRTGAGFTPRYAPTDLTISDGGTNDFAQVTTDDDQQLAFSWDGNLPTPEIDGSTATYKDVAPGEDLVVEATPTGFEHSLVLNERPTGAVNFTTGVDVDGAKISETADGGAVVKAPGGDVVATIPQPVVSDSSGNVSSATTDASDADLTGTPATGQDLTVTADKSFLQDPDTEYPVTIDPVVQFFTSGDTWIEKNSSGADQGTNPYLQVGTADGGTHIDRAYIGFNPPSGWSWANKTITSADLVMFNNYSGNCGALQINASRLTQSWTFGGISWSNQPSGGANAAGYTPVYGGPSGNCGGGDYADWDVTGIVSAWAGGAENDGIRLMASDESSNNSFRKYYSANHPATPNSNPHINITYDSPPNPPTNLAISPTRGGTSTNSEVPTLSATLSDPDGGQVSGSITVSGASLPNGNRWIALVGPVNSGSTVSVQVPTDLLSYSGSYSFTVSATDGTLSAPLSSTQSFSVDSSSSIVPAPTCSSPCTAVTPTDLVTPNTHLAAGQSQLVTVNLPGGADSSLVGSALLTATAKNWTAPGSLTITDADATSAEAPTLSYGSPANPSTGTQTTVQAIPSAQASQVLVTNNGSQSVDVGLAIYGWIPWADADEAALDAPEDSWDDSMADPSDDVVLDDTQDSTTSVVTQWGAQAQMMQTQVAADPIVDTPVACVVADPTKTCFIESADASDSDVPAVSAAFAALTVPEVGQTETVAAAAASQNRCQGTYDTKGWVYTDRFNACRNRSVKLTVIQHDVNTNENTIVGQALMDVQRRMGLKNNSKVIKSETKYTWLSGKGEASIITPLEQQSCNGNCAGGSQALLAQEISADDRSTPWYATDFSSNTPFNGKVTNSIDLEIRMCESPSGSRCGSARNINGANARCDNMSYLPGKNSGGGCVFADEVPTYEQSKSGNAKETAKHMEFAQSYLVHHPGSKALGGIVLTRKWWGGHTNLNRKRAVSVLCPAAQYYIYGPSCDEYPFASTYQGCALSGNCHVTGVPLADNKSQGGQLGNFYARERIMDSDKFWALATT